MRELRESKRGPLSKLDRGPLFLDRNRPETARPGLTLSVASRFARASRESLMGLDRLL